MQESARRPQLSRSPTAFYARPSINHLAITSQIARTVQRFDDPIGRDYRKSHTSGVTPPSRPRASPADFDERFSSFCQQLSRTTLIKRPIGMIDNVNHLAVCAY